VNQEQVRHETRCIHALYRLLVKGKTETTKLMLQYLSTVASEADDSDSVTLGDQMVQANALMEVTRQHSNQSTILTHSAMSGVRKC
jgi:hypothetical protein